MSRYIPDVTTLDMKPGDILELVNADDQTAQDITITFGEYGSITFGGVRADTVRLTIGQKAPEITVNETGKKPSIN